MQPSAWLIDRRATPHKAAAFPFFYIEPAKNKEVIQPYVKNGFPVEQMAPIGEPRVLPPICSCHVSSQQHWMQGKLLLARAEAAVCACHDLRGQMWGLPVHVG